MPLFDLPLAQLIDYRPDVAEPADFDEFWSGTLAEARTHTTSVDVAEVDSGLTHVDVFDVTFPGFAGHPIKAWYARPAGVADDLPIVVNYIGYSGGRGLPHEQSLLPSAGYAYLKMDTRGQGYSGNGGDTPDPVGSDPAASGYLTRGIADPAHYYYRRVFTDAARAVDAARTLPGVDPDRVIVSGGSQGGGIATAAAALVPDVAGAMIDVPFLQYFRRAVEITASLPYAEITNYLAVHRPAVDRVWETLSYFDGVNLAKRAQAPALYSVALMDPVCPPSTVYAAYNAYGTGTGVPAAVSKQIEVYGYNGHEGGAGFQVAAQLRWLADLLR
ncbi:alpha/beta fold hydrolase [Occultella aeris]|uniref:Cephalosporin-C deacetylase n=1 Tax=Occultella aeris TaxID=2761496 RepID=A0A7M4DIZ3_9MICO|nr:alpha/beta fold hydrolase [Occultella aeris]VZO36961.1 Cephalosporin-C deacetylase [Occultella aeris]